jgi:3-isopropylmalate/(R)-2-methylmalate dehydratase small subunit
MEITTTEPDTQWTVDLESMTLSCSAASFPITMPAEPREALMQGKWDAVVELMNAPEAVAALAASLPAPSSK